MFGNRSVNRGLTGPIPSPSLNTAIVASKATVFRPRGERKDGLDARDGHPGNLPRAFQPTWEARTRTPGASRPPMPPHRARQASAWAGSGARSLDPVEEVTEQLPRHRRLRHLEDHVATGRIGRRCGLSRPRLPGLSIDLAIAAVSPRAPPVRTRANGYVLDRLPFLSIRASAARDSRPVTLLSHAPQPII